MTKEVGAITGAVECSVGRGGKVTISYEGSEDKYTVLGSPVDASVQPEQVFTMLTQDPGVDTANNPIPVDLTKVDHRTALGR